MEERLRVPGLVKQPAKLVGGQFALSGCKQLGEGVGRIGGVGGHRSGSRRHDGFSARGSEKNAHQRTEQRAPEVVNYFTT